LIGSCYHKVPRKTSLSDRNIGIVYHARSLREPILYRMKLGIDGMTEGYSLSTGLTVVNTNSSKEGISKFALNKYGNIGLSIVAGIMLIMLIST
jgi:hypothetical protein